jgi:hypothetical protein
MKFKTREKLKRIYKALATTDEKTVFTLKTLEKGIDKLKSDLEEVKKRPVSEVKEILIDTPDQPFDTTTLDKKISDLEESFNRTIVSFQENLVDKAPDYKNEIEDLSKEIETLKRDILTRIATLGGGSPNQKISVNGTWATKRYADIDIISSGATVTNDDTKKVTKIELGGATGDYLLIDESNEPGSTFTYNVDDTLATKTIDDVTKTFTYNGDGTLASKTDGTSTWTYNYTDGLLTSKVKS